jgi:uncharacterized protein YecE (DUF72 family)
MATDICIGTASWTDPGFVEDWYPKKLPANARLRWYAGHFNYVEVNATFYALPEARTVERWCSETPGDFLFDLKLPQALSRDSMKTQFLPRDLRDIVPHQNGVIQLTAETEELIVKRLLRELEPLVHAGKLGVFLLQLSPSFHPRSHALAELDTLRKLLTPHSLAVELRNRDWIVGDEREKTENFFRERHLTLVSVDAPESEHFTVMPGVDVITNPKLGYFRLHGRKADGYIKGRSVAERFDYDYSEAEVQELAKRIRKVSAEVEQLRIVANNNRSNYAPKLARRLQELLLEQEKLQEILKRKTAEQPELI